ncbi:hypothetical protein [Nocardioides sp. W7]|uniref:hypothetical protein n=1 Tax=Nocardioides sp. W7 TaxID=2931390 RepID=UPI001FD61BB0|nr:hypothetical protein [Nocardioides sp. W7]
MATGSITAMTTYADADARLAAYSELAQLAEWSTWAPLLDVVGEAPRRPGVYLFLERDSRVVRHVGHAGERAGSGSPQGLYGRLRAYLTGQAAVSGFVEAALDRALADPDWVRERLAAGPQRTRRWAGAAVRRLELDVSWATCTDRDEARWLEGRVVELLRPHGLWVR